MIFVDASAIVAILTGEAEDAALIAALERAEGAVTSPIAIYEAALGFAQKTPQFGRRSRERRHGISRRGANRRRRRRARRRAGSVGGLRAYGKGTQHPAQLNMGDCFCLRPSQSAERAAALQGRDFSMTDIEAAR